MVIIQLTGGLGNQLFQYAIGRALISKSKEELLLDTQSYNWDTLRNYSLNRFNIKVTLATPEDCEYVKQKKTFLIDRIISKVTFKKMPYYRKSYIIESSFSFDKFINKYRTSSVYLQGYWQSEKYFAHIRSVLLNEICVNDEYCSDYFIEYKTRISSNNNSVSIHIRRGDYVSNSETMAFHGVCEIEYYQLAMSVIEQMIVRPTYFVFSDDIEYAQQIFGVNDNVIFIHNVPEDYEELMLMSLCKHNIIANSSFSWWGAWLNRNEDKKVIAPKRWFANEEMQLKTADLIPNSWIKL